MSCSTQHKKLGGREPADPNSREIQEIASWAVTEYNRQHRTCLKLVKVLKAETQVVAGINYYLDLEAANGFIVNMYFAKVFDQPWTHTRKLLEFKPLLQEHAPIAVAN